MAFSQTDIQKVYDWIPPGGIQQGWLAPTGQVVGNPDDKVLIAIQSYKNNFGRPPTVQELNLALPQFQGPNGEAYVASLAQQQQQEQGLQKQQSDLINQLMSQVQQFQTQQQQAVQTVQKDLIPNITVQEQQLQTQQQKTIQDALSQFMGQQQSAEQQQQQQSQKAIQDAIQQGLGSAASYFSPEGVGGQEIAGNLNNLGVLQGGAYGEALGSTLGQASKDLISQAIMNYTVPSQLGYQDLINKMIGEAGAAQLYPAQQTGILGSSVIGQGAQLEMQPYSTINQLMADVLGQGAGLSIYPWQQSIQQPYALQQQGYDWQQFQAQEELAQRLQEMAQPGWAEKYAVPLGAGLLRLLGALGRR